MPIAILNTEKFGSILALSLLKEHRKTIIFETNYPGLTNQHLVNIVNIFFGAQL